MMHGTRMPYREKYGLLDSHSPQSGTKTVIFRAKWFCEILQNLNIAKLVLAAQGRYNPYEPTSFVIDLFCSLTLIPAAIRKDAECIQDASCDLYTASKAFDGIKRLGYILLLGQHYQMECFAPHWSKFHKLINQRMLHVALLVLLEQRSLCLWIYGDVNPC